MGMQEAIKSDKMLLVEGKDEILFFDALLKYLAIDAVYVTCAEGKDNIANEYAVQSKRSGFSAVTRIGFVRDAEAQEAELPFKRICKVMKKYTPELPVPEKTGVVVSSGEYRTGIFIMPDCSKPGMIEDLCLASVANEELLTKAQVYVADAESIYTAKGETAKQFNRPKALVQTYLAGNVPIVAGLGTAALKGVWNFDDPVFDGIKRFCRELFE